MTDIKTRLQEIRAQIPTNVRLVCVSKFHPAEYISEAYANGERDFGESRAQELMQKIEVLPKDIRWHFIGPLQSNKVKYLVPTTYLIHSVENEKLLAEIEKQASKHNVTQRVLLEVHIAQEESKHGFSEEELNCFFSEERWKQYPHVEICGLMGIATLTNNDEETKEEFRTIHDLFNTTKEKYNSESFCELSIGMSHDFPLAINEGATMVRVGSAIFGERDYSKK